MCCSTGRVQNTFSPSNPKNVKISLDEGNEVFGRRRLTDQRRENILCWKTRMGASKCCVCITIQFTLYTSCQKKMFSEQCYSQTMDFKKKNAPRVVFGKHFATQYICVFSILPLRRSVCSCFPATSPVSSPPSCHCASWRICSYSPPRHRLLHCGILLNTPLPPPATSSSQLSGLNGGVTNLIGIVTDRSYFQ